MDFSRVSALLQDLAEEFDALSVEDSLPAHPPEEDFGVLTVGDRSAINWIYEQTKIHTAVVNPKNHPGPIEVRTAVVAGYGDTVFAAWKDFLDKSGIILPGETPPVMSPTEQELWDVFLYTVKYPVAIRRAHNGTYWVDWWRKNTGEHKQQFLTRFEAVEFASNL